MRTSEDLISRVKELKHYTDTLKQFYYTEYMTANHPATPTHFNTSYIDIAQLQRSTLTINTSVNS